MDTLEDKYDLIVIGTGFPETILATAANRIEKSVLVIDTSNYYGGCWASLNLKAHIDLLNNAAQTGIEIKNASFKWIAQEELNNEQLQQSELDAAIRQAKSADGLKATLLKRSWNFSIDVYPKLCYFSGAILDLLIAANICKQTKFCTVDRLCALYDDQVVRVPCTRSDVYVSKDLDMVEKREFLKILEICKDYINAENKQEAAAGFANKTFREYLEYLNAPVRIKAYILHAIALCTRKTSFAEGMKNTKRFLDSMDQLGSTTLFYPKNGCGSITQHLSRACAKFGGNFHFKCAVGEVSFDAAENLMVLQIDGKPVKAKHIVCSHGNVPANARAQKLPLHGLAVEAVNYMSRGVFITNSPIGDEDLNSGLGGVIMLRLVQGEREAIVVQMSHFSGTCAEGSFLIHITTPAMSDEPQMDIKQFREKLFTATLNVAPTKIIFESYFTITAANGKMPKVKADGALAEPGIWCTAAPFYEFDYEQSLDNVRDIFKRLYGGMAEFLPRTEGSNNGDTNSPEYKRLKMHLRLVDRLYAEESPSASNASSDLTPMEL